jgi:transcriptional regulator with XRE-family HTH domain
MNKQPTWVRKKSASVTDSRARFRLSSLDRLHAAMTSRDITSGYQLAQASGVNVSTINHLVHGHRRTASAATVRGIREALGPVVDDLFALEKSQVSVDHASAPSKRRAA